MDYCDYVVVAGIITDDAAASQRRIYACIPNGDLSENDIISMNLILTFLIAVILLK